MRRILFLALLAVGLMASPASAQYEGEVLAEIENNVITGSGCPADSTVTFTLFDLDAMFVADLGSTTANASGEFSAPLDFSSIAAGDYVLEISCGDVTSNFELTVVDGDVTDGGTDVTDGGTDGTNGGTDGTNGGTDGADDGTAGSGDELPRTGSDMSGLVRIGAVLFAAGGLLLLATRRKNTASA